ncbi:hypothetical protein V1279_007547 [Bradyrhizobium sp. AZCC 1610]|uniref:hypothetical protein n=1 Tax=Bradyrhizobium sp. AZCC 1610 TaxID=3117020 RepID=UPI002FF3F74D
MDHSNYPENPKRTEGKPPDSTVAVLEVVEIDLEIEDREELMGFSVVVDERFHETLRARIGVSEEMHLFEHGHDQPLSCPPHGRKAIRLVGHRCPVVMLEVRYEHRTIEHRFAPSETVFKALQWAVGKKGFNLDPVAAAKANLILPGADAPLPREAALGKFVKHGHCTLVVDLTLKDFSNG